MADAKRTDIDPDGNVMLELTDHDSRVHLLVSSKALSLASPVIDRMFKSRFKEGLAKPRPSSAPPVVPLPDDDPEVMTVLCNVVHHRMASVPRCLSLSCVEKLTIAADKYDCVTALTHSSLAWLQPGLDEYAPDDHLRLLYAAYVLDEQTASAKISWQLVSNQIGSFRKLAKPSEHELVDRDFCVLLKYRRYALQAVLIDAIGQSMPSSLFDCPFASPSVAPYLKVLCAKGLWPPEKALRALSIADAAARFRELADVERRRCPSRAACRFCRGSGDASASASYRSQLVNASDKVLGDNVGLCLDCVKRDGKKYDKVQCRVKHA